MTKEPTRTISRNEYFQRLKDPIVIVGIMLFVNFLVMLIINLINPVILKSILLQDDLVYVFWNGKYKTFELDPFNEIESGFDESYPKTAGWLLILSIVSSMIISIIHVIVPVFKSEEKAPK